MDGWTWEYQGYDPDQEGLREALCTVGNGYLATRGAAPESVADQVHYPGTYGAGIYNRLRAQVGGQEVENESLVNLPNWLPVRFRFDGGRWFSLDRVELLGYRLRLDLRRAVLTRWFRFRDQEGRTSTVTQRRFVDMSQPHVCALDTTVRAEDWDGTVEFESGLDGRVRNTLVRRYRDLPSVHLEPATGRQVGDAEYARVKRVPREAIRSRNGVWTTGWPATPRQSPRH
jgi:alpha,alpha-trehalase